MANPSKDSPEILYISTASEAKNFRTTPNFSREKHRNASCLRKYSFKMYQHNWDFGGFMWVFFFAHFLTQFTQPLLIHFFHQRPGHNCLVTRWLPPNERYHILQASVNAMSCWKRNGGFIGVVVIASTGTVCVNLLCQPICPLGWRKVRVPLVWYKKSSWEISYTPENQLIAMDNCPLRQNRSSSYSKNGGFSVNHLFWS